MPPHTTKVMLLGVTITMMMVTSSFGFVASSTPRKTPPSLLHVPLKMSSSNSESSSNSGSASGEGSTDNSFMESLRARQVELLSREEELDSKWKSATCHSRVALSMQDWIRRMDVADYPLVACGSSSGNIVVADLETGDVLAKTEGEDAKEHLPDLAPFLRILYSGFDGGGTIAVAAHKDFICSAGRQGSVQLWRLGDGQQLVSQGSMVAAEGTLVTCLHLDDDYLWVGRMDGKLQAFSHHSATLPLALQQKPELEWNFDSPILSMSLAQDIGYGIVTTAEGSVELFDMEDDDDDLISSWIPSVDVPPSVPSHLLSSELVPTKDGGYVVATGTTDGSLHTIPLAYKNGLLDEADPWLHDKAASCKPKHQGSLKCLTSPLPGWLISAGQDGSMRLWDVASSEEAPNYMYQFVGYKVWIGSLWSDGKRIVSDGADNTIVIHDFDAGEEPRKRPKKRRRNGPRRSS
uniref:Anaphase-promoting complex subunit 4 WD40 domain-containing protein n=1 Tax=Grammatophora oceanica TaxID=210454 RepID=A0A7S1Y3Q3_9STRA|mmetsp:Transcript_17/g.27  ORF Transcript_17/g.27 Transcript_17/m.27 type:complete len:463 (+) Transcript_17:186-1574(+)|eukprot:CAMPEP_0194049338 /NCGR_PEP_ID=MMETSP0009_2-20130614/30390_1 /TAXON_ID=210454 /ORGANISM="Grammatophora oceanica, Strain CCMP 410" /LENGTH=462 /DNA_ID=CAMNT_0038695465 /DNA_START=185 /DNA_END=1573 /DNA_ORIENTATION=+